MLIARSVHPLPGEAERKDRLLSLVDRFANRHVAIVGDLGSDAASSVAALGGRVSLAEAASRQFAAKLPAALGHCDVVLLFDQGSGLVTPALADTIHESLARRSRRRPVPTVIGSTHQLLQFRGQTMSVTSDAEIEHALGFSIEDDERARERAGTSVLRRTRSQAVLAIGGARGMALFQPKQAPIHFSILGSVHVAKTRRARTHEAAVATVTLALASGASFYEAARLASYAHGLAARTRGRSTVSAGALGAAVANDHDTSLEDWSQEGPQQGRRR